MHSCFETAEVSLCRCDMDLNKGCVAEMRHLSCCRFSGRLVKLIPPYVRTQLG